MLAEVKRVARAKYLETHAMLPRDIGKAAGDIGAAGKDDTINLGADCCQRRPDIIAAIEKSREAGLGNGLLRRGGQRLEPTRTRVAAGVGRAGEQDLATGSRRRGQCSNGMAERMNDDDRRGGSTGDCFVAPLRSSQ